MSANIIIKKKYLAVSQPDGFVDGDVVRTRTFRKTATVDGTVNAGDTFTSSDYLAVAKLPKGFVVEGFVADVIKANGSSSTLTVSAAKNASIASESANNFDSSDLVTLGTVSLGSTGQTFAEVLATGEVASTTATLTTAKWVAGDSDYIVFKASADVDAEFVVRLFGRWLPPEV